jgi:hypothetical protein
MNRIALIATGLATLGVISSQALAAPVVADSTTIGSLSGSSTDWPALWPTSNVGPWEQYLVTRAPDGTTFLNAGSTSGNIIFRGFNGGARALPGGGNARAWLDQDGIFFNSGLNVLRNSVGVNQHGIVSVVTGSSASAAVRATGNWIGVDSNSTSNGGIGVRGSGGSNSGVEGRGFQSADGVRGISSVMVGVYASSNNGANHPGSSYAIYADGAIAGNNFMSLTSWVSATGFFTVSDQRLKKDIADYNGGLSEIDKIHVVKYKYNGKGETRDGEEQVGVLAQELEQTHPAMVSSVGRKFNAEDAKNTDIKMVNQTAFTYMLINAVKELKGQVSDLQKIVCQDHPEQPSCGRGRPGHR